MIHELPRSSFIGAQRVFVHHEPGHHALCVAHYMFPDFAYPFRQQPEWLIAALTSAAARDGTYPGDRYVVQAYTAEERLAALIKMDGPTPNFLVLLRQDGMEMLAKKLKWEE